MKSSNVLILMQKIKNVKNQLKTLNEEIIKSLHEFKKYYKFLTIMKIIEKEIWENIKVNFRQIKKKIYVSIKNKKIIIKFYNNVLSYLTDNEHNNFANDIKIIDQKIDSNNLEYYRLSLIYNDIINKKKLKTHIVVDTSDINLKDKIKILYDNYTKIKELKEENIILNRNLKNINNELSQLS